MFHFSRFRFGAVALGLSLLACSEANTESSQDQPSKALEPFASLLVSQDHAIQQRVEAQLPPRADGWVALRELASGLRLRLRLAEAKPVRAQQALGNAYYEGALGSDAHWVVGSDFLGVKDSILFETRPARAELEYRLDVRQVSGLRQVESTLEFLDSQGTPRLRMAPPWILDAAGKKHTVGVQLHGCQADQDARAPWGREVTDPGADECTLRLWFDGAEVHYPALLDPEWTSTQQNMAVARSWHQAALLGDGRVLVAGGIGTGSAELYDPATDTWAGTESMSASRWFFQMVALDDGSALAIGGRSSSTETLATAERYQESTFTAVDSMEEGRRLHAATVLSDGKVLVAGGLPDAVLESVELFDPTTNEFEELNDMNEGRQQFTLTPLANGDALAVGGQGEGNAFVGPELYARSDDEWSSTGEPSARRRSHTAVGLADGRVLVAGGYDGSLLTAAEIYDPGTNQWSLTDEQLVAARSSHVAALMDNGAALVAGGCATLNCGDSLAAAELFDPDTGSWHHLEPMGTKRVAFTATRLADGSVLVAGGRNSAGAATSSERLELAGDGEDCGAAVECQSGTCSQGSCEGGSGGNGGLGGSGGVAGSGGATGGGGGFAGAGATAGSAGFAAGGTTTGNAGAGASDLPLGGAAGSVGTGGLIGSGGAASVSGGTSGEGAGGRGAADGNASPEENSLYGCAIALSGTAPSAWLWWGALAALALGRRRRVCQTGPQYDSRVRP